MKTNTATALLLMISLLATQCPARVLVDTAAKPDLPTGPEALGHYVVAISATANSSPGWKNAATALCGKYMGKLLTYPDGKVASILPELQKAMPNYVCFVTPPEQAGRDFVVAVHRLMRQLNADPYTDALWGILTGYEAKDAQRIAALKTPLVIKRAASSMGNGILNGLDAGFASDEGNPANFWTKTGKDVLHEDIPADGIAKRLAAAFNTIPVDLFITSGHATQHDWQIIYNVNAGSFRHENGKLFAQDTKRNRYPFSSPSPKAYLPAGNCLIGNIDRPDCMTTAWIHSGGVAQMVGYTVVTFYGYMGWGTKEFFDDANLTLAESFYANSQTLISRIKKDYPAMASEKPAQYDNPDAVAKQAFAAIGKQDMDALGMLWDRDTVAFYGDPAWQVRYSRDRRTLDWRLEENGGNWTLTGKFRRDVTFVGTEHRGTRPVMFLLPQRVNSPALAPSSPAGTEIHSLFVSIPFSGEKKAGETFSVSFTAK
jgi:hypothetical protein